MDPSETFDLIWKEMEIDWFFETQLLITSYYMALACGRYNARSDWLIVTEL